MCRAKDPHFQPEFPFRAYHFHKLPKNPFRSITILYVLADFAVPETIIFKMTLISTRSSPPTAGSAAAAWRPEIRIFTLKTDQARSGAPHFQAQNGSSSFRSPAFHARPGARSGALAHFSLCRGTYLQKFGLTPPPGFPLSVCYFYLPCIVVIEQQGPPGAGVDYCRVRCFITVLNSTWGSTMSY